MNIELMIKEIHEALKDGFTFHWSIYVLFGIINFIICIVSTTLTSYFSKRAEIKAIKHDLTEIKKQIEQKIATEEIVKKTIPAFQEILEAVYRFRNFIKNIKQTKKFGKKEYNDIELYTHSFSENLYKYKLFLHEDIFDNLHTFKRTMQNLFIHIDVITRDLKEEDKEKYIPQILEEIEHSYPKINSLYKTIDKKIHEKYIK